MIFYNNLLAKWFLRKGKKHCFMLGGLFFTRYKYLEIWEDMEVRIHARQFWECFLLTLLPALVLSLFFSWWWMLLPFATYHIFYWLEKSFRSHSVFDWEALENSFSPQITRINTDNKIDIDNQCINLICVNPCNLW